MTRLILSVFTLSLLTGCPVFGPENDRPGPGQRPGTGGSPGTAFCNVDEDCTEGSICDFDSGSCFDVSRCVTDGDCPAGSYCDEPAGECVVPQVAMCSMDTVCENGFECDFRDSCRPAVQGDCEQTTDCAGSDLCVENRCVAETAACTADAQCPTGAACVERLCTFLCDDGSACPSGTACNGTSCETTAGECVDSSDCPDLRTNCVTGRCLTRCTEGCDAATETCDDEGFCRPRALPDPDAVAPLCTTDAECNASTCVEGVCRASCDPNDANANDTCEAFDGQVPVCGADGFCYAEAR